MQCPDCSTSLRVSFAVYSANTLWQRWQTHVDSVGPEHTSGCSLLMFALSFLRAEFLRLWLLMSFSDQRGDVISQLLIVARSCESTVSSPPCRMRISGLRTLTFCNHTIRQPTDTLCLANLQPNSMPVQAYFFRRRQPTVSLPVKNCDRNKLQHSRPHFSSLKEVSML